MKQCNKCGEMIEGEWELCPHCGAPLEDLPDIEKDPTIIQMSVDEAQSLGLPRGVKAFLEVIAGPAQGMVYEIKKGRITVGRGDADLIIKDPKVSRKHFSLEIWSRDIVYIQDLASTNGTYLNGTKITKTRLKHGDVIQVGDTRLRFVMKEAD